MAHPSTSGGAGRVRRAQHDEVLLLAQRQLADGDQPLLLHRAQQQGAGAHAVPGAALKALLSYAVFIGVLLLRPEGLFWKKQRAAT